MTRVMVFGKSKRKTRKVAQIARAFKEQGHDTLWLNPAKIQRQKKKHLHAYLLKQIEQFQPEIIFFLSQDIPLSILKHVSASRIKTVMFYVDSIFFAGSLRKEAFERMLKWAILVDYFLVTAWGLHNLYRLNGIENPTYFIDACDRHDHKIRRPYMPIWKSDVAFIGTARRGEPRVSILQELYSFCKVKVYGKHWKDFGIKPTLSRVKPWGYSLICGGAKIILGADTTEDIAGCWSNRLWLTLGCGGFLLTNYVEGMEYFFRNRQHLVWYHNDKECISLVQEFLEKPDERQIIATQGYHHVHTFHEFHHFVNRVIQVCEGLSPNLAFLSESSPAKTG